MAEAPGSDAPNGEFALYRYRFADAEFDEIRGELRVDGVPVQVEPRPLAVLAELLRRPGEVVSKEELFQSVWAGQPTVDNVVANAIAKLRKVLRDTHTTLIVNVPRVGYRLDGKVERHAAGLRMTGPLALAAGQPVPGREAYVLEAALGRTRHGDVWLARHAKLHDQRVFKFAADGERLMGLRREYTLYRVIKEALGEREDFARVVDANLANPPFYLECEFGGQDLGAWAASGTLAALGRSERLALFMQIAQTVADAHNVGVLHKDLKPSNVLIELRGERWHTRLTDFGSGRLLDPSRLEAFGVTGMGLTMTQGVTADSRSGTVLYLAPELLALKQPSAQSDLYALGLMLFQLLAGDFSRPITPGWEKDIDDPLLRADIVDATHARPQDRLGSVAELIERIRRLDERREQARQAATAQALAAQVAEQAQRTRLLRPWLIALGAALCVGLAGTTWQWRRADAQRLAADTAARQAQATLEFLKEDVLGASDPFAGKAATPVTVRQALAAAAGRIDTRFQGFPAAQGLVHAELGGILHRYGELSLAASSWDSAIAQLAASLGPAHPDTLAAMYRQSTTMSQLGQPDKAKEILARADALLATPGGGTGPLLVYQQAAHSVYLATLYKVNEAVPHAEAALQQAKALNPPDARLIDRSYSDLSSLYQAMGQGQRNIALTQEWLADLGSRPNAPPNMSLLARARLAAAFVDANRLEDARPLVAELAPKMGELLGKTSNYSVMLRNLACDISARQAQRSEAARCLRALVADIKDAPNVSPVHPWLLLANVGIYEAEDQNWRAADQALEEALDRLGKLPGTEAIQAMGLFPAVEAKLRLGDLPAAVRLRAKIDLAAALNADPARAWGPRLTVIDAMIAQRQGQLPSAARLFDQGVREFEGFAKQRAFGGPEPLFEEAKAQAAKHRAT